MSFLVFQVGCSGCGVSSYPIKVVKELNEAINIAKNHPSTWKTEGGDGYVTIIDLDNCTEVDYD